MTSIELCRGTCPVNRSSLPTPAAALASGRNGRGLASRIGTEIRWIGPDPDTAEVQTVGIPTGLHGKIRVGLPGCMLAASQLKESEFRSFQVEILSLKFADELRRALPVQGIASVIIAAGVVKKRKQLYDLNIRAVSAGYEETVIAYPCPMPGAVDPVPVEHEFLAQKANEFGRYH